MKMPDGFAISNRLIISCQGAWRRTRSFTWSIAALEPLARSGLETLGGGRLNVHGESVETVLRRVHRRRAIPRLALQVRATSRLWSGLRRDEAVATCIKSRTNGSDDVLDVRAGGPQDSPQRDAGYGCVVSIRLGRSTGRDLSVL